MMNLVKRCPEMPSSIRSARWEAFLRVMAKNVSEASVESLTVRCWKASALILEIKNVVKSLEKELKTTFPSAGVVVDHFKRHELQRG